MLHPFFPRWLPYVGTIGYALQGRFIVDVDVFTQMFAHYLSSNYLIKAYMMGPNPPMFAKHQTMRHFRLELKRNGYVKEHKFS